MSVTKIASGVQKGRAVCGLPDGSFVVASGQGLITRYDAAGTELDSQSLGFVVSGLTAHPAGAGVFVASPSMGVWELLFGPPLSMRPLRRVKGARGVAVDVTSTSLLVASNRGDGTLRTIPVSGKGKGRVVARGVGNAHAVARRTGDPTAWVLRRGRSSGPQSSLAAFDANTGDPGITILELGLAADLSWLGAAGTRLVLADAKGRVLVVDTRDPAAAPVVLADGLPPVWSVDLTPTPGPGGGAAVVAGIGDALALVDLPPVPDVQLEMPAKPLYLSSWARIGVALSGGLTLDDLLFRVEAPEGGLVSQSRDATFATRPSVILATHAVPGSYKLVAQHATTGDELAAGPFDVTDAWEGPDGPPVSVIGAVGVDSPDPAWGGGDPFVPQNLDVTPALGTKHIAVVAVETNESTALSAADQATLRTAWRNEVFDGVTRNGVVESTRNYWRDVSDNQVDLSNAGVVGPIRLPNNWASYGTSINATTGQTDGWAGFARAAVADLRRQNDAAVAAGNPPVVDLMTLDSMVLVIRSLPAAGMNPGRFIWPSASRPGGGFQISFEVGQQTISIPTPFGGSIQVNVPIIRTIQVFSMPDDWETRETSGRLRGETAAHELGHNLGLPDEYARPAHDTWARDRDLAGRPRAAGVSWSLMSWEEQFPQTTVVEKMRLGWVDAGHVRNLSFATLGPVDETITLHASDLGPPPAGRFSTVEVRIADGHNYYFEYRRERPTTTSDQDVPADRTVVGIDCRSGEEPSDRRNILRIKNDADNDNGEFQAGDNYTEQDTSDPSYPNDFRMSVLSTDTDSARIRIQYGDSKPDPQIRPWAPSTNWKSPDLRVTNARYLADNRFRDIPWEGHDNRIVATVRNPGQRHAPGVRVDFFVRDFTLGGGAETALGSETRDVNSGTTVEFTSTVAWVPPPLSVIPFLNIRPHYCVVARIAEYADPADPTVREITRDNNEAQSNHTQLISVNASPSSREMGFVKVTNPLPAVADCRVQVRQTGEWARTYVEHEWVRLQPGEQRDVMFLTESLIGDPLLGQRVREFRERIYKTPNSVRLTGIADDHQTCEGFVTGGAHVLVRSARATRWVKFSRQGGHAFGRVETVDDRTGVDGKVLVTVWPKEAPEKAIVREGQAVDGDVNMELGRVEDDWLAQGHFLGGFDVAPCDSDVVGR